MSYPSLSAHVGAPPSPPSITSSGHSGKSKTRAWRPRSLSTSSGRKRRAPSKNVAGVGHVPLTSAERDLRLLSAKAAESYKETKFDLWLARHRLLIPYLIFVMLLSFSVLIGVIALEEASSDFATYGRWVWRVSAAITIGVTLPAWVVFLQWRPATPLNGEPEPGEHMPTVDIAICCYKEDVTEIVDTIVACQRVEYPVGLIHVYLLDDGRRQELDDACNDLHRTGLLRHPLTYVNRPTNEGKKGGNINHWLRKFEHECGEFFIILDADMQPFPDMLDILMGHFFGLSSGEQERLAYIQAPQWYRTYNGMNGWMDFYSISEFFFYRVLQPANSTWGCTVYVGCCALWKRQAIESVNGFISGYATEDSVTGCQVNRTKVPGSNFTWISKYVMQPVAAGLSPLNLPDLMEQRLRWYVGLCEMLKHHNYYFFASGLKPMQRVLYWVTATLFISNTISYASLLAGTTVSLASIIYYSHTSELGRLAQWAYWGGPAALFGSVAMWAFIPGCTFVQYFHTMASLFMYTPVYFAAILRYYFGIKIKVQATAAEADGGTRRWHPFYLLPIAVIMFVTLGAGVALWQIIVSKGSKTITPYLQLPMWIIFWLVLHYHVIVSMLGFSYDEIDWYADEARGGLCDPTVKAHLKRHVAQIDPDDGWDSGEEYSSDSYDSREGVDNEVAGLGMSLAEKNRVKANLRFHQARQRAVTQTIIAESFALGDNTTFSCQNTVSSERECYGSSSTSSASDSGYQNLLPDSGSNGSNASSLAFQRRVLAAVQAETATWPRNLAM
jgi:cellulose synthase/poly-beta-1,6-N-acetylglucosamine synthase-like glycosyltransferase